MTDTSRSGDYLIFPQTRDRVQAWRLDPHVVGVVLVGSKSHEHHDEFSDDDLEVVLADAEFANLAPEDCIEVFSVGDGPGRKMIYDAQLIGFSALADKMSSTQDLDHWPYERARVLFDRDGKLGELVAALGSMESEFKRLRLIHATIDAWIAIYRTGKTERRGFEVSTRLLLARAARALVRLVFALEGRWVPLDHWLGAELKTLEDRQRVVPLIIEGILSSNNTLFRDVLSTLEHSLALEGVPRAEGRHDLFLQVIHPSRAAERGVHGLQ